MTDPISAAEDGLVAFAPCGLVELGKASIQATYLIHTQSMERRLLSGKLQQVVTNSLWAAITAAPIEAVCEEPPARNEPASEESP